MPEFKHKPVLLAEVLEALRPRDGSRYVDGTLGGAGHARAILEASAPGGLLFGCDRDSQAFEVARERLAPFGDRVRLRQGNFTRLAEWVEPGSCDGVLLDLGVSSHQLDSPERGFSFLHEGPLDMRMDQRSGPTAADLVNTLPVSELASIFLKFGEERQARKIARAIDEERSHGSFRTTGQLAGLIDRVSPRKGRRVHPATRVFQALRMVVNDELGALESGLATALGLLRPEGRLAVITFHSLEDRMVKQFGRTRARDYEVPGRVDIPELRTAKVPELKWVTRKPIEASVDEVRENARSRSARLRVMEKV